VGTSTRWHPGQWPAPPGRGRRRLSRARPSRRTAPAGKAPCKKGAWTFHCQWQQGAPHFNVGNTQTRQEKHEAHQISDADRKRKILIIITDKSAMTLKNKPREKGTSFRVDRYRSRCIELMIEGRCPYHTMVARPKGTISNEDGPKRTI
jgi:hypothetical protein